MENLSGTLHLDAQTAKIKKIQGSDRHVGKRPMVYREESDAEGVSEEMSVQEEKAEVLSKRLKEAVSNEDFELAAKLRDEIAELRGKDESNA